MARSFTADRFRDVLPMLAALARQDGRPAQAVENPRNAGQRRVRVTLRPFKVARILGAKVADQPRRKRAGQGCSRGLSLDVLCSVVGNSVGRDRTRGIKENVVRARVSRRELPVYATPDPAPGR